MQRIGLGGREISHCTACFDKFQTSREKIHFCPPGGEISRRKTVGSLNFNNHTIYRCFILWRMGLSREWGRTGERLHKVSMGANNRRPLTDFNQLGRELRGSFSLEEEIVKPDETRDTTRRKFVPRNSNVGGQWRWSERGKLFRRMEEKVIFVSNRYLGSLEIDWKWNCYRSFDFRKRYF